MDTEIKPMQHLLLWRLAVGGGEDFQFNLPALKPAAQRTALVRAGLVAEEKRPNPRAKTRPVGYLTLTDKGWGWCQDNMVWPEKAKSPQAGKILELLLPRLHTVFGIGEPIDSLGDFIGKSQNKDSEMVGASQKRDSAKHASDLHESIRTTCRILANGKEGVRIRLADLRSHLNGFAKDEVTKALWELSERGEIVLYRLDDPRDIKDADHEAAVLTSTGEEKHILYFGGMAS